MEASFESFRAQLAPQTRGSWNVVETQWLRRGRPDPEFRRRYVLREDWPGYGPARAHGRSSTDNDGLHHEPHVRGHAVHCQINKVGWVAWTSIELPSRAMLKAEFSCVEPGDPDALFDSLNC